MKVNPLFMQIVNFGIVGVLAFFIDFGLLIVLTEYAKVHYLLSAATAFSVSVIFNYFVSMRYVFLRRAYANRKKEFVIFFLLSLIGLCINQAGLYFLVETCSIFYVFAKIFVTLIVMVWNFLSKKFFLEERYVD